MPKPHTLPNHDSLLPTSARPNCSTQRKEYANTKNEDDFLQSLAESGIVVGELAKCYYPDGHDVKPLDYEAALSETNKLLEHDNVVIFEAAIKYQNLFCRVDVLVKEGDQFHLIEVKAKSVDGSKANPFQGRKGNVLAAWKPYVRDVAFQRHVLNSAFPCYKIRASLCWWTILKPARWMACSLTSESRRRQSHIM